MLDEVRPNIIAADAVGRALEYITQGITERNDDVQEIILVGLHRYGVPLARRIATALVDSAGQRVLVGELDTTRYQHPVSLTTSTPTIYTTRITTDITGYTVILVDAVLGTGCKVRAALKALTYVGRPAHVQLAVLLDRGNRALPIRADFVGKTLALHPDDRVEVTLAEVDGDEDMLRIIPAETAEETVS